MIGRAVLDWIRDRASSGPSPSGQTILGQIWESADHDRPRARMGLRAEPPAQNPLWVLNDASVEFVSESGALQVFAITPRTPVQPGSEFLTLDEALAGKKFLVSEAYKGGSVSVIRVRNRCDCRVLLMAGEVLVGCKQDRVINKSIMVGPRSGLLIPVSCVEAGRWRSRSRRFGSSGHSTYAALRESISQDVSNSYRARGTADSNQRQVWCSIRETIERMGSTSDSNALHQIFEDYEERMSARLSELTEPGECQGVVFAVKGRIVGADLFDRSATLTKLWPKLVKTYVIDSMETEDETPERIWAKNVADWLKTASDAKTEWFDSPGLGKDGRFVGPRLHGAALVVDEQLVHLEMFSERDRTRRGFDERWNNFATAS